MVIKLAQRGRFAAKTAKTLVRQGQLNGDDITTSYVLFLFLAKVWSPSGGWWSSPANWKRNTGIATGVVAVLAMGIFTVSASKERRPIPPVRHIPSQYWCKHAIEDDPRLAK